MDVAGEQTSDSLTKPLQKCNPTVIKSHMAWESILSYETLSVTHCPFVYPATRIILADEWQDEISSTDWILSDISHGEIPLTPFGMYTDLEPARPSAFSRAVNPLSFRCFIFGLEFKRFADFRRSLLSTLLFPPVLLPVK
jgi:hypothetical protein